ncbi:MAG: hypothetical protein IPN90_13685 [Elusimicrobia bacterium]|nr:hypothetical protein [Elusimicrobiota bacterium]
MILPEEKKAPSFNPFPKEGGMIILKNVHGIVVGRVWEFGTRGGPGGERGILNEDADLMGWRRWKT